MSEERSMSYTDLSNHAVIGAKEYLIHAIRNVNELMGEGAAQKHPELVAAMVQAAASEYLASMFSHRVTPALEDIAHAISSTAE